MSLLLTLINRVVESGLIWKILKILPIISKLLLVISVALIFGIVPMDGSFRNTYISENALMPNQAYSQFRETEWNIVRGFRNEISSLNIWNLDVRNRIVRNWLDDFGLETDLYQTDFDSPFSSGLKSEVLYGVLNGQRCDGTEAMLIAAPWYNSENSYNVGGVSVAVALTKFFTNWPVWSKNIILVIPETPGVDLRAWVESYHKDLKITGGSIESAMILDYAMDSDSFDHLDVEYIGLNGGLPNLDMVNTAIHVAEHEGVKVSINGMHSFSKPSHEFKNRLEHIAVGLQKMAFAGLEPLKGHEAFSGWRIQAITLKAVGHGGGSDITTFGRIPEAVTRSVNNLLEKFHQSFFFYLLLSPKLFVSIANYIPAAILLSVAYAAMSIHAILKTGLLTSNDKFIDIQSIEAFVIYVVTLAVSILYRQFVAFIQNNHLSTQQQGKFILILQIFFVFTSYRVYVPKSKTKSLIQAMAFMHFSLALTLLLALNFGLCFGMGVLAYPMALAVEKNISKLKQRLFLLISNPFIAIFFMYSFTQDKWSWNLFNLMISSWDNIGCWTWPVVSSSWLVSWILVVISCNGEDEAADEPKKAKQD